MLILILILTIIFAFVGFLGNIPEANHLNPFIQYIFLQLEVFLDNPAIFLVTIGIVFFTLFGIDKMPLKHKNYPALFLQTFLALITGFFFSFLLLFVIAWLQLNMLSISLHIQPGFVGITTNMNTIVGKLKTFNQPPRIIASDNDPYKELVAIGMATTGTDNFYGSIVLKSLPTITVFPTQKSSSSILLLGDTLIVTKLNHPELTKVSPVIGYLFVQRYFPTRAIKINPKITVMTTNEFATYRKQDAKEKLVQIAYDITLLQTQISSLSASMQNDTDTIAVNQQFIKDSYAQKNAKLSKCEATGTYQSGTFTRTFTDADCKNLGGNVDIMIDKANATIDSLTAHIQESKSQQTLYKNYVTFFTAQRKLSEKLQENIPYELGVFVPKNTIKIAVDETNAHEIADYFETLTHEYLHFASYQDGKHFTNSFFEEGLTEYFARQAIHDELAISTNLGYPVFVKIISQMMKIIPESEMADIYFTKDETRLETTLNRAYGDNFYNNTYPLFQALQYTTDPQQTIQLANGIMKRIGGKPLQEKDFFSTSSSL